MCFHLVPSLGGGDRASTDVEIFPCFRTGRDGIRTINIYSLNISSKSVRTMLKNVLILGEKCACSAVTLRCGGGASTHVGFVVFVPSEVTLLPFEIV